MKDILGNKLITVKTIVDENFQDYKSASMFLAMPNCDFKCFHELNLDPSGCQNSEIAKMPNLKISIKNIFQRYIQNPITKAIIFGGLEPFLNFDEVLDCASYFRLNSYLDDIIIYTGYYPHEIEEKILKLKKLKNIIIKFGRFIPNSKSKFDDILGICLASDNQFSCLISEL
ncbi:MAG: radical SAM protein [Oscillospiraceae bacterium]|jgi:hypothetical protein|nr:radical SAM protein [Oscillospiraceae bacterium]